MYIYICMHIYMYIHIYIYVYVYIYIHMNMQTGIRRSSDCTALRPHSECHCLSTFKYGSSDFQGTVPATCRICSRFCASDTGVHVVMMCSKIASTCSSPMALDAADASVSGGGSSGSLSSGWALLAFSGPLNDTRSDMSVGSVDKKSLA